MITELEYSNAIAQEKVAREIINRYHRERAEEFQKRLKENPVFTDEELFYAATSHCNCGHGLAYPKDCTPSHYWDCSAILKGVADKNLKHVGKLPFAFYDIKGESEYRGTTRGKVVRPFGQE